VLRKFIGSGNEKLIDANLICDNSTMTALSAELNAIGDVIICHNCYGFELPIAGLLVIEQDEEAWLLCGDCLGRLPLAGLSLPN
jgi:hypothetical protein